MVNFYKTEPTPFNEMLNAKISMNHYITAKCICNISMEQSITSNELNCMPCLHSRNEIFTEKMLNLQLNY